jgi:hypothetical protein
MKFNIFSNKKKKDESASIQATDFLNPRDGNVKGLKEDDKKEKDIKTSDNKKEDKLSKRDIRKAEKERKAKEEKAKKEAKKKAKEAKKKKIELEKEKKKEEKEEKKNNKKSKEENREEGVGIEEVKNIESKDKEDIKDNEESQSKEKGKNESQLSAQSESDHEFEKSNILEINLVKDQINVYFDWYKNIAMLVVFVFLSAVLVAEIYLALSWWQSENDSAVGQEEQRFIELSEETREIRAQAEEALTFQTKLNRANYILDNHLYWSNFFNYLEKNTLENVQYKSFEGDILGNFTIPAVSNNFPSLGQQIYQLQSDPNTLEASISNGEKLESTEENLEQVEFEIDLKVSPKLFKK